MWWFQLKNYWSTVDRNNSMESQSPSNKKKPKLIPGKDII